MGEGLGFPFLEIQQVLFKVAATTRELRLNSDRQPPLKVAA